ncbi:electron transfer flavoprotein subunit beta/FixA family protein [Chlorobium sp. N1]|uniref:electron transfer flavoprotein subunit beta/FixA family protein n=1 Tax=Chlorobium sp. N1 TaxID=2491138 RepID=UPI00103F3433|nr:electron transfer flavoprotein subunit beta/FixA family protein [Chlorobium sp. N1]TCD48885.1 electron transfer flavoprotein beta subunit/FixA family protein [Chlorobium sp. N1]
MEIAVCVTLVPDTASVIGFRDGALDTSRISEVLNPYDEYALEEALLMRERQGDATVRVFSVAPASKKPLLQKALAMGADRLVIVEGPESCDPWQTASILREAFRAVYGEAVPELVLCGRESTDFRSGEVPGMLATLLGVPSLSGVTKLEAAPDGTLRLEREIEGGLERFEARLPILLSAEKGLNTPRKTSMKGVMEARKKPVEVLSARDVPEPRVSLESLRPAERHKECRMAGDVRELVRLLRKGEVL